MIKSIFGNKTANLLKYLIKKDRNNKNFTLSGKELKSIDIFELKRLKDYQVIYFELRSLPAKLTIFIDYKFLAKLISIKVKNVV